MPDDKRYDLGGIMLGNGWIDPFTMYMSYADILRANNLLTDTVQTRLVKLMDSCAREFRRAPQPVHTDVCEAIPMVFLEEGGPSPGMCYNMYDLRLTDTQPSCGMNWPPEVGTFTSYLNRKDVQRALNVRSDRAPVVWKECSSATNTALRFDTSPPSIKLLPGVLEHVPVLLFVGQMDYLCNYIGIEWAIGNMTWAGATGLSPDAVSAEWTVAGDKAGQVVSDRGLTYAKIYDASHMVGVDRPREILDLFTVFTNASSRNLGFTSSFRALESPAPQPTAPTPPEQTRMGVPQWVGVGFALFLTLFLAVCLLRRKQIFNWWIEFRRRRMGMRRLDDVAERFDRLSVDEDDAFAMSEFVFGKRAGDEYDDGLLLDESMASSPDEDIGSTVHGGSSNHSPIRKNSAP
ncbi:Cell death protease [Coemansia sp. RSA 2603]|nr:Cell death protease [Coemansia sp. RSA 2603]